MNRKLLGESLIEAGFLGSEQLSYALALQEKQVHAEKLGRILVNLNYIDEDILLEYLGKQCGIPKINLRKENIDEKVVSIITRDIAEKYNVISVGFRLEGRTRKLIVAMTDPLNLQLIDTISFLTGYIIEPVFAKEEDLKWNIKYYYNKARVHVKKQVAVNSSL